jgi:hypothetical protein
MLQKQAECEMVNEKKMIHQKQYGIFQVLHTVAVKRVKVVKVFIGSPIIHSFMEV